VLLAGLPNRLGLLAASLVGVAAGVLAEKGAQMAANRRPARK
jgi:hypothetical protein